MKFEPSVTCYDDAVCGAGPALRRSSSQLTVAAAMIAVTTGDHGQDRATETGGVTHQGAVIVTDAIDDAFVATRVGVIAIPVFGIVVLCGSSITPSHDVTITQTTSSPRHQSVWLHLSVLLIRVVSVSHT